MFCRGYEFEYWSIFWSSVGSRFWILSLVEMLMFCWCWVKILKMKFDQDLCLNLQYDFGKMNSTLGSVVPLAMFLQRMESQELVKNRSYWKAIKVREKKEIDQITFKKWFTKGGEVISIGIHEDSFQLVGSHCVLYKLYSTKTKTKKQKDKDSANMHLPKMNHSLF